MEKTLKCIVCGNDYESCASIRNLQSWRVITDTSNHYKIYLIINDYYNKVINKAEAGKLLAKCDINGYEKFSKNISNAISEIISENSNIENSNIATKTIKTTSKKENKNKQFK